MVLIFSHTLTHKHNGILHNSLAKVEWIVQGVRKAVLISSHTITHKPNGIFHNSPPKVENGLCRERGKAALISIHTVTHKLRIFSTLTD